MMRKVVQALRKNRNDRVLQSLKYFKKGKGSKVDAQIRFLKGVNPSTCSIEMGEGSLLRGIVSFERNGAALVMGNNSSINNSVLAISEKITFGNDVLISYECLIMDHNGHSLDLEIRKKDLNDLLSGKPKNWIDVASGPVFISDGVWIGTRVLILKNVTIGNKSIVAAGAVVTKSMPAHALIGGNPARVIKENR